MSCCIASARDLGRRPVWKLASGNVACNGVLSKARPQRRDARHTHQVARAMRAPAGRRRTLGRGRETKLQLLRTNRGRLRRARRSPTARSRETSPRPADRATCCLRLRELSASRETKLAVPHSRRQPEVRACAIAFILDGGSRSRAEMREASCAEVHNPASPDRLVSACIQHRAPEMRSSLTLSGVSLSRTSLWRRRCVPVASWRRVDDQ